jgi:hypothetical protein
VGRTVTHALYPSYSPHTALVAAAIIGGLAGLTACLVFRREERISMLLGVPGGAAVFSLAFAILNPLLQTPRLSSAWLRDQITTGRLTLRAVSVYYGVLFLAFTIHQARSGERPFRFTGDYYGVDADAYEQYIERPGWRPATLVRWGSVYMLATAVLWIYAAEAASSTVIALLNWLTAFAVAQFAVVARYRVRDGIMPTWWEQTTVIGLTAMTGALFVISAFQQFDIALAVMITAITVLVLAIVPGFEGFVKGLEVFGSSLGVIPPWVEEELQEQAQMDDRGSRED